MERSSDRVYANPIGPTFQFRVKQDTGTTGTNAALAYMGTNPGGTVSGPIILTANAGIGGPLTTTGNINTNGYSVYAFGSVTVSGGISGSGGVVIPQGALLTITAPSSYTGSTIVIGSLFADNSTGSSTGTSAV